MTRLVVDRIPLIPGFQRLLPFSTSSFSSSSATSTDCFANYLVDSLGFPHQQALSVSTKLYKYKKVNDLKFEANANSVVTFFRHYGFNDTHIIKMVSFDPRLLNSNAEKTLSPKLQSLRAQGFALSDLIRVISVNPNLLLSGSEPTILSAIQILRQILVSDAIVVAVLQKLCRHSFGCVIKDLMPNVDLLRSYGIPIELIRKHLIWCPGPFFRNPEKFKDIVIRVEKKLGITRDSRGFLYGIQILSKYSEETIESKCRMFKSFGWTQSDVETLMMKNAICFTISEESIKKKLDFFMNALRLKPAYMISNSALLTYSLEKRLVPRHKVLVILKGRGFLEKWPTLSTVVRMSEPCFLKRFVIPFKEVHQIYAKHTGCSKMQSLTERYIHHLHGHSSIAISSSTSTAESFANYLVDSLGFSHQQALSTSTKLYKCKKVNDLTFEANANSVVTFFKSHGFNDTHLRKMVNNNPSLLCSNVDITIRPKLMFLQHQGFSGSDLIRFIYVNPKLLSRRMESYILPALEILRQVMGCDTLDIALFKKLNSWDFGGIIKNMKPNVDFLTSYGIPVDLIKRHIGQIPRTFVGNPEKLKEIVIRVENKLGIPRHAPMFLYGVHLLFTNSEEAIESKCQIFKSFGWTQSDVDTFMMKIPSCFSFSDATIKKKLDFLTNELRIKPAYLTTNIAFFTCSLEKRVVPRHKVWLILKEKGLLEKNPSLGRAICIPEPRFLEMFVIPFNEVHQVYAKHTGCSMKMLTEKRADDLHLPD